jgi:hypothetical protein
MGERLNTYFITNDDISDDGIVRRPFNNSQIHATQMMFEKPDGTGAKVIECLPAGETLCPAICSCGQEVNCSRITLVLDDGNVAYPASCCHSIQFFDGRNE